MNNEFAQKFASEWVADWNSHDLNRVLSDYADDFEMSSPVMINMGLSDTGTLQGKDAIRAY